MKAVVSILLGLFFASGPALSQTRKDWITFSPKEERFEIAFPTPPNVERVKRSYGPLNVEGLGYTSQIEGVIFKLWVFSKTSYSAPLNDDRDWPRYRNAWASLMRESLLKPLNMAGSKDEQFDEQLPRAGRRQDYAFPGPEYYFKLGRTEGAAQIFLGEDRIYALAVLNAKPGSETAQRFLRSFVVKSASVADTRAQPATVVPDPELFGQVPDVLPKAYTYQPVYLPEDTTVRARINYKPEPYYTNVARQNRVVGTVVLRVILARNGKVIDIREVKGLPYGLTEMARKAAQQISFEPAQKDGHPVSQYLTVEYHFSPN
jgi:TonB family protein